MKSTFFFIALLFGFGCASKKKTEPVADAPMGPTLISLETSPCRGYCPVFKLTVLENGKAQYEGIRFVKTMDKQTFDLTPIERKELQRRLNTTNLWQYPESFPTTIVDAPGATITVHKGSEKKEIRGSVERPKPIREIQDYLQNLAKAHGIDLSSADPNAPPPPNEREELLVQLKPDVNAGNWLRDLNLTSKAELKMIRRLGEKNIWLVAFDKNKFKTDEILDLLKANEQVLEAQLNRTAEERKN